MKVVFREVLHPIELEFGFLGRGENRRTFRKTSWSRAKNHQPTLFNPLMAANPESNLGHIGEGGGGVITTTPSPKSVTIKLLLKFLMIVLSLFISSSQVCLPYLKRGKNPHILNISPPLNMKPHWFKNHVGKSYFANRGILCFLLLAGKLKD